jgi:ABC-type transport system involved in cytochrome bd biosynthesis fused ATPase/permease subunit
MKKLISQSLKSIITAMPRKIKYTIIAAVSFTVFQFLIDMFIAISLGMSTEDNLGLLLLLAVLSVLTRPLVLIVQHRVMRKCTVLGIDFVLRNLFTGNLIKSTSFTSELLLKSANLPIYVVQPLIHFLSSLMNIIFALITTILLLKSFFRIEMLIYIIVFIIAFFFIKILNKNYAFLIKKYQEKLGQMAPNFIQARKELFRSEAASVLISEYITTEDKYRTVVNKQRFLTLYPKQAIESFLLIGLVFVTIKGTGDGSLAAFGSLGIIGLRSLPQLGNLIAAYSSLIGYFPSTATVFEKPESVYPLKKHDIQDEAIIVRKLSISHARFSEVSFKVNRGDKLLLDMPSGYGKTSILDVIAGIYMDGTIYQGEIGRASRPYYLQQNTFILEDTVGMNIFLNDQYNVLRSIKDIEFVTDLLKHFGLGLTLDSRISRSTLSGGEIQRLAVIRMIVSSEDIYIIDEALSALDEDMAIKVIDVLSSSSASILMTVHNKVLKKYSLQHAFEELVI